MEKSSSNVSASSSLTASNRGNLAKQGNKFVCKVGNSQKCWCGSGIVENVYGTQENPYRRYYRCGFAAANKLCNDRHVFKWVDEAYMNEIEQLCHHVAVLEEEVKFLKLGSNVRNGEGSAVNKIERMQTEVFGSVEEMLVNANMNTRWLMASIFGACLLMIVLVILLKK